MKVLHIMASCWRGSGVAHAVVNYQNHMPSQVIFDYLLFSKTENSFEDEILSYGGMVYYSGRPSFSTLTKYIRWFNAFFEGHHGEYDAVQVHDIYLAPIILPIAKKSGIETRILHSHSTKLSEKLIGNIRNRFLFTCARLHATDYFACSVEAGLTAFGNKVVNGKHFTVVPNSINVLDYKFFQKKRNAFRAQLGLYDDIVIGNVGRCTKQKHQLFLVDIFAEIHKKNAKTKLLIIGDGPLKFAIQNKVARLGLCNNVILLGGRKNVGDYLSAIDAFVFPSLFEGLGIVLIEAQCNGLPCVVSKNLPSEINILPTLVRVSLSEDASVWADATLSQIGNRTRNAEDYVIRAGYEIGTAALNLSSLYDKIIRSR